MIIRHSRTLLYLIHEIPPELLHLKHAYDRIPKQQLEVLRRAVKPSGLKHAKLSERNKEDLIICLSRTWWDFKQSGRN